MHCYLNTLSTFFLFLLPPVHSLSGKWAWGRTHHPVGYILSPPLSCKPVRYLCSYFQPDVLPLPLFVWDRKNRIHPHTHALFKEKNLLIYFTITERAVGHLAEVDILTSLQIVVLKIRIYFYCSSVFNTICPESVPLCLPFCNWHSWNSSLLLYSYSLFFLIPYNISLAEIWVCISYFSIRHAILWLHYPTFSLLQFYSNTSISAYTVI